MKEFIKKLLSSENDVSSKRFSGIFCIVIFAIVVAVVVLAKIEMDDIKAKLLITLFIGGLAALGVASVEKLWKP